MLWSQTSIHCCSKCIIPLFYCQLFDSLVCCSFYLLISENYALCLWLLLMCFWKWIAYVIEIAELLIFWWVLHIALLTSVQFVFLGACVVMSTVCMPKCLCWWMYSLAVLTSVQFVWLGGCTVECTVCMPRWLHLVPDEVKTSQHTGETGYDSYLRDAQQQVFSIISLSLSVCLCLCFSVCLWAAVKLLACLVVVVAAVMVAVVDCGSNSSSADRMWILLFAVSTLMLLVRRYPTAVFVLARMSSLSVNNCLRHSRGYQRG